MEISVELLAQLLNQLPNLEVTVKNQPHATSANFKHITFEKYALYWLEHYKLDFVKGNTYQGTYYEPIILHLIPFFGATLLQDVTPQDVQAFFKQKRSDGYALETLQKMRNCLNAIFITAIEERILVYSPITRGLRLKSNKPPATKNHWTKEQYDLAMNFVLQHPKGLSLHILLETGISRSELLGLVWSDFDPGGRFLSISNGLVYMRDPHLGRGVLVHQGLKNKYRRRNIPITKMLAARLMLQANEIRSHKGQYIIHAPRGGAYNPHNWHKREFIPVMDALVNTHPEVIPLTPHELRHTVATVQANEKLDLHLLAQLLGHSDLDMLAKRYLHPDTNVLRSALGR